jgi:hypothetical protein
MEISTKVQQWAWSPRIVVAPAWLLQVEQRGDCGTCWTEVIGGV